MASLALCAVCYTAGGMSLARFETGHRYVRSWAARQAGSTLTLEGRVASFPSHHPGSVRFAFDTRIGGRPVTLLASVAAFEIGFGDSLSLTGTLSGGRIDRRGYLHSRGAAGYVRAAPGKVRLLKPGSGLVGLPAGWAWNAHESIRRRLASGLGARCGLPMALSIGDRGRLPRSLKSALARAGVSHLLALSGMHLGMVAASVLALCRLAGRRGNAALLAVLAVYVLVVGRVVSLYRAYALAAVLVASSKVERRVNLVHGLGVATFVLLAAQPRLARSVAFQLSFAATFGVLVVVARLPRPARGGRARRAAARAVGALAVGVGAQLFLLPLQLRYFGGVTPVTPLATLLLLPPVAGVMVLTAITLVVDFALPSLSLFCFGVLGHYTGVLERAIVVVSGALPAPIHLPEPNLVVYYAVLAGCLKIFDAALRRPVL
jgi:ComEC/Rec2-related protein